MLEMEFDEETRVADRVAGTREHERHGLLRLQHAEVGTIKSRQQNTINAKEMRVFPDGLR